MVNPITSS